MVQLIQNIACREITGNLKDSHFYSHFAVEIQQTLNDNSLPAKQTLFIGKNLVRVKKLGVIQNRTCLISMQFSVLMQVHLMTIPIHSMMESLCGCLC